MHPNEKPSRNSSSTISVTPFAGKKKTSSVSLQQQQQQQGQDKTVTSNSRTTEIARPSTNISPGAKSVPVRPAQPAPAVQVTFFDFNSN